MSIPKDAKGKGCEHHNQNQKSMVWEKQKVK
jgi:hypothetical protein